MIDDLDADNTYLTEEDQVKVIKLLRTYTRKVEPLSKYQAYTYLKMSRATFDNLVSAGKIPKGQKRAGFKELCWYKKDLDSFINRKNNYGKN